jgi:pantoate--beta-alanine ligase
MILFKHSKELQSYLGVAKQKQRISGFVPTMGALHEGHLSLISRSRKETDLTICSIFVNPTQFNNAQDFEKYPSAIEQDILLLEENGCDILFMPSESEIYPDAASKDKHFDLGDLENKLEGQFRPGHFQGVCTIVEKLVNLTDPSLLFLGQKDYQQCLVITKLLAMMNSRTSIVICPILREPNGLAMSSRNLRLSAFEKDTASKLYATLLDIRNTLECGNGDFAAIKNEAVQQLVRAGFIIDYLELAKRDTLVIVADCSNGGEYIILIAAFLNSVRLIDNIEVNRQC